jgi:hypothetical protein
VEGIAAPFFVASALLALAGGAKLVRPEPTVGALKSIGLPGGRTSALALGLFEVVVGAVAIVFGGPIAATAVAISYAGFAGFVVLALRKGGAIASCGCFGTEDTPPTVVHLVLNILASVTAASAAIGGIGGVPDIVADQPAFGIPFLAFVALGTWFAYLALSVLPTLIPKAAAS